MAPIAWTTWVQLLATIALTSVGQLLLKLGAGQPEFQGALGRGPLPLALAAASEPLLLAGVGLYVLSTLLWMLVLARLDLSMAYPIAAANFVIVVALSWAALGETISPSRAAGALLIIAGVICIARPEMTR